MLLLKGITAKLFKGAIFICSDMHAIPGVPIEVALTEIQNRICHFKVAFHWISLSWISLALERLESNHIALPSYNSFSLGRAFALPCFMGTWCQPTQSKVDHFGRGTNLELKLKVRNSGKAPSNMKRPLCLTNVPSLLPFPFKEENTTYFLRRERFRWNFATDTKHKYTPYCSDAFQF